MDEYDTLDEAYRDGAPLSPAQLRYVLEGEAKRNRCKHGASGCAICTKEKQQ